MTRTDQINCIMSRVRAERDRHLAAMCILRADRTVAQDMPSGTYTANHKRAAQIARIRARAVAEMARHREVIDDLRAQLQAVRGAS